MKRVIICLTAMSFFIISCSKTNEEAESKAATGGTTGGTTNSCDTVNMKYATNIQPILQKNCYSCHGNGQATSGVTLDAYQPVRGKALNGLLINVITHASGYPAMPYNQPKLSDCDINKIKDWIAWGALNN